MAPSKKATSGDSLNASLQLVMKSGKYHLGFKSTLKALRSGKAILLLLSSNCPQVRKSQIEYLAYIAKTDVRYYHGSNIDLGTACGKFYRVSMMAITDAGDSDIMALSDK